MAFAICGSPDAYNEMGPEIFVSTLIMAGLSAISIIVALL
jgi:hypothetical protein